MTIDVKNMTPAEREKLKKAIEEAEEAEQNAYKTEFVERVAKEAISLGITWSEALSLFSDYKPKSDAQAKKLGYRAKKGEEYYFRKVSGSELL